MKPATPPASSPLTPLERVFIGGLALIFGLIALHAPLSVFFGVQFGHELIIKAWKEILMGILLVLALIIVTQRRAWGMFVRDPFIWVSLALALLYAVSLQYGQGFKPYAAGLLIDLRYILYAVLVYVAARLFPQTRPLLIQVGLIGAVIVVGFGLLQFVLPKDFLSILGYSKSTIAPYTTIDNYEGLTRLQSMLRGPNPLGAYSLIVALVAGIAALKSAMARRSRIWLGTLAVAALIVLFGSYSRSAYIGLAVGGLVAGAVMLGKRRLVTRKVIGVALIVVLVATLGIFAIRDTTFYTSVLRHEVAGSGPEINSDEGHSSSLSEGWSKTVANPLGYGTGSTGSASLLSQSGYIVENQYLYIAHEAGWLALVLFIVLVGILLKRAYNRRADPLALGVLASGIGLLVIGMFLPVFADDTVSIIWFGLAALVAGGIGYGKQHSTK